MQGKSNNGLTCQIRISRLNHISKNGFEAFRSLKLEIVEKCAELLGLHTNKVREVFVARGRWCAQTDCSELKRTDLVLLFPTSCVLVLC